MAIVITKKDDRILIVGWDYSASGIVQRHGNVIARRFTFSSSLLPQHHQQTSSRLSPSVHVVNLHISVSPQAKLALRLTTQRGSSISTRRFGQRHHHTTSHHLIRLHGKDPTFT